MTTSRNFSDRFLLAFVALAGAALLSACSSAQSSVTDMVNDAVKTASGKISDVKKAAENVAKPVIDTVNDAKQRIDAVGSGITKLQQGIDQVKEAVNR
jgi:peptidoglycan hydrolase CwlO-like protein